MLRQLSHRLPTGSGHRFHCFRHRQIRDFDLGLSVLYTRLFTSFGGSARQGFPGKPRLAGCGIIGLRCVFQAGSISLRQVSRPLLPNNSFKPTWLSPRGLITALGRGGANPSWGFHFGDFPATPGTGFSGTTRHGALGKPRSATCGKLGKRRQCWGSRLQYQAARPLTA